MIHATYSCDRCGAQKGAANHWFVVLRCENGNELIAARWDRHSRSAGFGPERHLCGERCLLSEISDFARNGGAKVAGAVERLSHG